MGSQEITSTYVVRVDRVSYPGITAAIRQGDLRRSDEIHSGMRGGTVYRPARPLLDDQALVHDRLIRLGALHLAGEFHRLPEQEYASLVTASRGAYRQYPGAHPLMTRLLAPMAPAQEAGWLGDVRAAVAAGRQLATGVDLVDDHWVTLPWLRAGTRLVNHASQWFLVLVFDQGARWTLPRGVDVVGADIGLSPLVTVVGGPTAITAWDVREPVVPPGEPAGVREFAGVLGYAAARASLEFVALQMLSTARVVVLEDLDYARFSSRFPGLARGRAVADWHQAWLPQRAYARGIRVVRVRAAYSSRVCSLCQRHVLGTRVGAHFHCGCGHSMDAHVNAARNLVRRYWGQVRRGQRPRGRRRR